MFAFNTFLRPRSALWSGLLALLVVLPLGLSAPVFGQEEEFPPLPRPRPDRESGASAAPAPEPETLGPIPEDQIGVPQPVSLSARISEDGPMIPDGLAWRVYDTRADENGQLVMAARSDEGTAGLSLAPGEYVVHVAYGRAQASDSLLVRPGPNTKTMVLDAGALRLNGAITGDIAVPADLLRFDIYDNEGGETQQALRAEGITPDALVHLNAGVYHVVSRFGAVNAVVRADLRVEPGQLTEATLYHRAGQVTFKLVSQAGGEAIADVDWTIQTGEGETVFTDRGAFPETVLAEGDYVVLARLGDAVYNRDFEVQAGLPREIEVLTAVY